MRFVVFMGNGYLCIRNGAVWRRATAVFAVLFLLAGTVYGASGKFTLVIDAGHGGHDTGALGAFSREKDINLKVALAFGRYVESNCGDVRVIYTRKTDVFIPLEERADIANKNSADLFISVHTNALPGGKIARGFETYTLGMHRAKDNLDVAMRENSVISMEKDYERKYQGFDPNSSESYIMFEFMQTANMEKSVDLAKMIQRSVCKTAGRNNKGVHQAGFLVLRQTSMPSCLIELGFITTSDEEEFLNTEEGVDAMACGIYNAFADYKNKYSDKVVVPYAAPKKPGFDVGHIAPQNTSDKVEQPARKQTATPKTAKVQDKKDAKAPVRGTTTTPVQKKETVAEKKKETPAVQKKEEKRQDTNKPAVKDTSKPVFKVQIFVVDKVLPSGSRQFKGHGEAEYYNDGGMVKYTIGASNDYDDILALRKSLLSDFPQAFIVAFRNGVRVDVNAAVTEFRKNK